jgi:hypothetical protein
MFCGNVGNIWLLTDSRFVTAQLGWILFSSPHRWTSVVCVCVRARACVGVMGVNISVAYEYLYLTASLCCITFDTYCGRVTADWEMTRNWWCSQWCGDPATLLFPGSCFWWSFAHRALQSEFNAPYSLSHRALGLTNRFFTVNITELQGSNRRCKPKIRSTFRNSNFTLFETEYTDHVQIQVEVFWVMTQCNVVVGLQLFGGPCSLHLHTEDISSKVLRKFGILPQH